MLRTKGFTIASILMLTIGLGLVTGAYTLVNGILIKGWDVPDNHEMFRALAGTRGVPEGARVDDGFSYGAFRHFREHANAAGYTAYLLNNFRIIANPGERDHYVSALYVSEGFWDVLQIRLQRGSGFTEDAGIQVILSQSAWRRIFGEDPAIIGRPIQLSGRPATVVGVLEPRFEALGERPVEALVELQHARGRNPGATATQVAADDTACCVMLAGRRRPGFSQEQVKAELRVLLDQYRLPVRTLPARCHELRDHRPCAGFGRPARHGGAGAPRAENGSSRHPALRIERTERENGERLETFRTQAAPAPGTREGKRRLLRRHS